MLALAESQTAVIQTLHNENIHSVFSNRQKLTFKVSLPEVQSKSPIDTDKRDRNPCSSLDCYKMKVGSSLLKKSGFALLFLAFSSSQWPVAFTFLLCYFRQRVRWRGQVIFRL